MSSANYEVRLLKPEETGDWDTFVQASPQGNIFCTSWWLDAVKAGTVELLAAVASDRIMAGIPLHRTEQGITMPKLTQTLGVLYEAPTSDNYEKNLSKEMRLADGLIEALPDVPYFDIRFHSNFTNWLPFYWAGYEQTTRYTYRLTGLTPDDDPFSRFAHAKRKNIKKSAKLVEVKEDLDAKTFYDNHVMTLEKQGARIAYDFGLFQRIYDATHSRDAAKTWYAVDGDGNIHAAILVIFMDDIAHYLVSTIDPDFRNSGASSLLVRDAIQYCSKFVSTYDFEGSMVREVESSFRKFGAEQAQYFRIFRDERPWTSTAVGRLKGKAASARDKLLKR